MMEQTAEQKKYHKEWQAMREHIEAEYDAIELAFGALAYMLRHTKQSAIEFHMSMFNPPEMEVAVHSLTRCREECLNTLLDSRSRLGEIMERVGNDRDGTDACTDNEGEITSHAFEAMHALEKSHPIQITNDGEEAARQALAASEAREKGLMEAGQGIIDAMAVPLHLDLEGPDPAVEKWFRDVDSKITILKAAQTQIESTKGGK